MNKIYRLSNLQSILGLSRSTIYAHIAQGLLTKSIQLGARAVGWPQEEVQTILNARITGKSEQEIKELVLALMLKRQGVE